MVFLSFFFLRFFLFVNHYNLKHCNLYSTGEPLSFHFLYSCGGNMLMNVGPPSHGYITPIYEERLRQMGAWLKVNGEGIYSSKPWTFQNDTVTPGVWSVVKMDLFFCLFGFLTASSTTRLYRGRAPRQTV